MSAAMHHRDAKTGPGLQGLAILALILTLAGLLTLAAPAAASEGAAASRLEAPEPGSEVPAALSRAGWKKLSVPGKAPAEFAMEETGSIRIVAQNAVAFLYRPIEDGLEGKSRLAWRWRVDQAVARTDLSKVGEDDRSLAVHLVFPVESKSLSFWERFDLSLTRLMAPPLAGKLLTYVWGGTQARGASLPNPHFEENGAIIVLRSGDEPTGRWVMEEIDFMADFRRAFGYTPPPPIFMAISSDSDDTAGSCLGAVADFVFS